MKTTKRVGIVLIFCSIAICLSIFFVGSNGGVNYSLSVKQNLLEENVVFMNTSDSYVPVKLVEKNLIELNSDDYLPDTSVENTMGLNDSMKQEIKNTESYVITNSPYIVKVENIKTSKYLNSPVGNN